MARIADKEVESEWNGSQWPGMTCHRTETYFDTTTDGRLSSFNICTAPTFDPPKPASVC